jgi:hypothetical protein
MKATRFALMLFLALSLPAEAAVVSGVGMSLARGLPFAGLLPSIALMPLVAGAIPPRATRPGLGVGPRPTDGCAIMP